MGENNFAPLPTAVYGVVLLSAAIAYTILHTLIVSHHTHENEEPATAVGSDLRGKISMAIYAAGIPLALVNQWI